MQKSLSAWAVLSMFVTTLTACGGSVSSGGSGGAGSLSGSVSNTTFTVASALAIAGADTSTTCVSSPDGGITCSSTSTGQGVGVLLTNRSDATCAAIQSDIESKANTQYANFDYIELDVTNGTGDVTPGTYDIVTSQTATSGAEAEFTTTTSACANALDLMATAGTITLTKISSANVTGTYNVTFGTQGAFAGSFDVAVCNLPDAGGPSTNTDGGQPPACQP
jgi:hypothetical protein